MTRKTQNQDEGGLQRYILDIGGMKESGRGGWVKYVDAQQRIAELENQVAKAYAAGRQDGVDETATLVRLHADAVRAETTWPHR